MSLCTSPVDVQDSSNNQQAYWRKPPCRSCHQAAHVEYAEGRAPNATEKSTWSLLEQKSKAKNQCGRSGHHVSIANSNWPRAPIRTDCADREFMAYADELKTAGDTGSIVLIILMTIVMMRMIVVVIMVPVLELHRRHRTIAYWALGHRVTESNSLWRTLTTCHAFSCFRVPIFPRKNGYGSKVLDYGRCVRGS